MSAGSASEPLRLGGVRTGAALLLAWLMLSACVHSGSDVNESRMDSDALATVIYIVRHAEKLADKDDPVLSDTGQRRAMALSFSLHHEAVDALYSSNYRRTVQTLTPLSTARGLEIQRYDAGDSVALVKRVLANHAGQRVVIAGHSNTVPEIVCLFAATDAADCAEVVFLKHDDYDRLYVVIHRENSVETLELSY